jgi:hypothetical protein
MSSLSTSSIILTLILRKMLDKGISADGNPKANVAVNHKARRREQRTEVIEGGIGVYYGARVLVVLGESPAPEVVDCETEHYHLERISLLSASLAPGVQHVAEVVKVAQVAFGGAHGPKILKHVAELFTNSLNIVTLVKAACVVTGGLAS